MDMRSKRRGFCVVLAGMGLFAASHDLRAATITLPAVQDATLFGGADAGSNTSLADPGIFVGTDSSSNPKRGLIEFNIAGNIPAGATITSVTLQLTVGQTAGGGTLVTASTINLFDESQAWGQPTNVAGSTTFSGMGHGKPAKTGDATWNDSFYSTTSPTPNPTPWTTAGGDWSSGLTASASASSTGSPAAVTWSSTAMVTDVQNWLNTPSSNFGWLLKNSDETDATDYLAFWSAQGAAADSNSSLAPALSITYTPVPEPTTLMLMTIAIPILATRRRRPIESR